MMKPPTKNALSFVTLIVALSISGDAYSLTTEKVASGLNSPLYLTSPPGDTGRLFIVEQTGDIRIHKDDSLLTKSFIDLTSKIRCCNERGLLGLAFDPDFATNRYFFVNYTRQSDAATVVERYQASAANPDTAYTDSDSIETIIVVSQDFPNHNGGCINFGPDGMLYIGMGDGGSGFDPNNNAQNPQSLLGKLLRLDVGGTLPYEIPSDNPFFGNADTLQEIWAYGLRNPWRWSFDRQTGDLYLADVGQNVIEEINFQSAASTGGEYYGWRCMEANSCTGLTGCPVSCPVAGAVPPITYYLHPTDGFSITGGYVYRGCAMPELQGTYFYADYSLANIWSFRWDGSNMTDSTKRTAELNPPGPDAIGAISSFGEDAFGELYIVDYSDGEVYKIVPDTLDDCNSNGRSDLCDIAFGSSLDGNGNDIPDECEGGCACDCFADPECDSISDVFDVVAAVDVAFRGGDDVVDPNINCPFVTTNVNCDSVTDVFDVVAIVDVSFRGGDPNDAYCNPCNP